jgi:hypothetical protein
MRKEKCRAECEERYERLRDKRQRKSLSSPRKTPSQVFSAADKAVVMESCDRQ